MNLTHLNPGDKIAIKSRDSSWRGVPRVSHAILTITKTTATQIAAENQYGYEVRVRRDDGKKIGEEYVYAVEATPEMLAEHDKQVAELNRWRAASKATDDLIGKELHQLKLTTAQLERLSAAWAEIKAMGSGT